jgi:ABC-type dipeptide/oligopeptide/nickel transport system permease component
LRENAVVGAHALKNAMIPIATILGLQVGNLVSGAAIVETVFAIPGVGRLIVRAIVQLDFPIVQAGVFTLAIIIVTMNFVVDVLYAYLNPTIRLR